VRIAVRTRGLTDSCLLGIVGVLVACGSAVSSAGGSMSASATSTSSAARLPRPCSFLTQTIAAQITGDTRITNQATNVTETEYGYVACIFADTKEEANSVEVQIKRVSGGVGPSALRGAAAFFSAGEPVQSFQTFPVVGVGDNALGDTTPGVVFIVFASADLLVYVGADSASVSAASLRASVENLAEEVAPALSSKKLGGSAAWDFARRPDRVVAVRAVRNPSRPRSAS
jgi:hypothetical protein